MVDAPSNIEAEQALLGAILINNEAFHRTSYLVNEESFFEPLHGTIYAAIARLVAGGVAAEPITLKPLLPAKVTDDLTMPQYLARLASECPTVINAVDYAKVLADLALRRSLMSLAEGIIFAASDADEHRSASEQLQEAEDHLFRLSSTGGRRGGFKAFSAGVDASVNMAAEAYKNDGGLAGLPTGLSDLDRMMGGLQKSDLIILAGRPGMGKTSLATNIAFNLASNGCTVAFSSLEMSEEQLATRVLSEQSEIPSSDLRRGQIHEQHFTRFADTATSLRGIPLFVDDAGGQSISALVSSVRRLNRSHHLDLLVVDYLQLLSGSGRRGFEGRVQEITEITTALKALAKELNIPVLALSQLSRQVENREDKRPHLADLRDSGSIEQDADVVLFVYREEYYLKQKEPQENTAEHLAWQQKMTEFNGVAEVIIGKQRHGPAGTVQLHFNAKLTKFSNLARKEYLPERAA